MTSTAAETWDDDEDFDLSYSSNVALELPRSDTASHHSSQDDLHEEVGIDGAGASFPLFQINKENKMADVDIEEDWNNDEDQVDTIKYSNLNSTTLAQLASFRKQNNSALDNSDLASLSLDGLPGKVTNMGSFAHISGITQDGSADWDQDLEMPDTFPLLSGLRYASTNITNEIDLGSPSFDSTSDATTSIRSTSDSRKRSPTQSSYTSNKEALSHSLSSSQCSHFDSCAAKDEDCRREILYSATNDSSEIESSFDLPTTVMQLNLVSHLLKNSAAKATPPATTLGQVDEKKGKNMKATYNATVKSPRYLNATAASKARQVDLYNHTAGSSSLGRASTSRFVRVPKRAKDYGDGRELDSIDDLPIYRHDVSLKGQQLSATSLFISPAVERANRAKGRKSGRRVEPTLIRNLGAPSLLPRIVGSMTWNPTMQRWEGNEEEARSFEKAVKGAERINPSPRLSSHGQNTKNNLTSTRLRGQLQGRSSPIGTSSQLIGAKVVGDMIFDPIKLCWNNKKKENEINPFAVMEEEEEKEIQRAASRLSVRPSKSRTSSTPATRMTPASSSSSSSSSFYSRSVLGRTSQSCNQWSAASINRVIKGSNWDTVPESLSNRITTQLWLNTIAAKSRHDEEMAGFIPTTNSITSQYRRTSSSNHNRKGGDNQGDHLYLIQSLARRSAKE